MRPPEVIRQLNAGAGADPVGGTIEHAVRQFDEEIRFYRDAARLANFTPE